MNATTVAPATLTRATSARARTGWRVLGALLLLLVVVPVYRVLNRAETGLAGAYTVDFLDTHYELMWSGSLLVLLLAGLAGRFLPAATLRTLLARGNELLLRWPLPRFAFVLAACAAALSAAFALLALAGIPNHIDSTAQLLQARFWAEGRLAGPASDQGGFWAIQNAVFTPNGWVSQYPPGHVAVLALFLLLGAPWAAGPVLVGVTVFCSALFAERLFGRSTPARLAVLLLALSPFFLAVGGSYMNHATAAAALALGGYALLRAWQGEPRWMLAAGFAFAWAFATRPLSALAMGAALAFTIPFTLPAPPTRRQFLGNVARLLAGAAPVLGALFAYNTHFFGGPLRSGYSAALGPAMRLGFHQDPWGNAYGPLEALGYTSSDLITLGINLWETPLPAVLLVALFLLWSPRVGAAERVVLACALAPLAAHALYWHHGLYMGPRMLHEAAPAWVLCVALAAVKLHEGLGAERCWPGRLHAQTAFSGALLSALLLGFIYLAPQRLASYGRLAHAARVDLPALSHAALVFVHDAWAGRVAMQLAGSGLRLDVVETATRQNATCTLQQLVDATVLGDAARAGALQAALDLEPRATNLPARVRIGPGSVARAAAGTVMTPSCARQARSDALGVLDLTQLQWQGDLPGSPARGALYVRDLGPARNAALLRLHPERRPYVYARAGTGGSPVLLSYDEGMRVLWSPQ